MDWADASAGAFDRLEEPAVPVTAVEFVQSALRSDFKASDLLTLNEREVHSVFDSLREHYAAPAPPPPLRSPHEYRAGLAFWDPVRQTDLLSNLLLWFHSVAVPDPLAEFIDNSRYATREELPRMRDDLVSELRPLLLLEPLVKAGVVVLHSPVDWCEDFDEAQPDALSLAATPAYAKSVLGRLPVSDREWAVAASEGRDMTPEQYARWGVDHPGLDDIERQWSEVRERATYLIPRLLRLRQAHARFHPGNPCEQLTMKYVVDDLPTVTKRRDVRAASDVMNLRAASLPGLSAVDAVRLRQDYEGWAKWQEVLAKVLRVAYEESDNDPQLRIELVIEELKRAERDLVPKTLRASAANEAKATSPVELTIAIVVAMTGAVPVGQVMKAVLGPLWKASIRERAGGAAGVLMALRWEQD